MAHDNFYETSISCFQHAIKALGSEETAKQENPLMYQLCFGLLRMAEGLLQENHELETHLIGIANRLPIAE
jgi:hypothetical protein